MIDILYNFISKILTFLPDLYFQTIVFPDFLKKVTAMAHFLLPMDSLFTIFVLTTIITSIRLTLSIVQAGLKLFGL